MFDISAPVKPLSMRAVLTVSLFSLLYLFISWLLIGFKTDQLVLIGLYNAFYYATPVSRKFITGFTIFIVYWIIYDYMKAFPNYAYNPVHIRELYDLEKHIFGIHYNGTIITPNEYWKLNSLAFLDVLTGIFYLCWIPVPMGFAVYLFFKNRRHFLYFLLTFFLVNMLGFVVYYLYPAAPPWYVQVHGFNFIRSTPGNTAGLARFDAFFNVSIFKTIYAKGSNVFAAMPSLHSSYPVIVLYYGIRNKLGWANLFFGTVMVGIWFAAVYTSHHYVLDVTSGILCAILGIVLFDKVILRNRAVARFMDRYEALIK